MGDFTEAGHTESADGGRRVLPSIGTSALKNAMELTNDYIANTHGNTSMFATIFFGILDPVTGSLLYVNGGHEKPFLINSTGIKEELATTGSAVGLFPGTHFEIREAHLEPGDTLVAFTDGIPEAQNSDGELFGAERLNTILTQPTTTAAELLDRIQASVQAYIGSADASDDITLLAVRRQ